MVLVLPTSSGKDSRFLVTRRLCLQWIRAMTEEVTQEALGSLPTRHGGKQSKSDDESPAILVDAIRLRRTAQLKYRIGFVHGNEATGLLLGGADLTRLLGILIRLSKGAGWDADNALARMALEARSGRQRPSPAGTTTKLNS